MTLKEQYWKDGFVFLFRDGDKRMVWGDRLIDMHGYIHTNNISDELENTDSTLGDCVVAIFTPSENVGYLKDFLKGKDIVWRKSVYLMTKEEIKEQLGIPEEEELIIIKL